MKIFVDILGYFAACLTTLAFLPQVIKALRFKKTQDLSLVMYILSCTGTLSWLVYGILIVNIPLIIANGITFVLAAIILMFKLKLG